MSKQLHKRVLPALLWLMLLTLLPARLSARDFEYTYEGQTLTYTVLDDDAKTVMTKAGTYSNDVKEAGNVVSGELILPETVYDENDQAYTLMKLGAYSFLYNDGLTSVVIPNSVATIGSAAFLACHALTKVVIPDSVDIIGDSAFGICSGLTSVDIPDSVYILGSSAFYQCGSLAKVVISNSITFIQDFTFADCSLTDVEIPNSVTVIGEYAFSGCALTGLILPPHVTTIRNYAFSGNSNLKTIAIGPAVTEIGEGAFYGAYSLNGVSITAVNPPMAQNDTFSYYDCPLYVMSEAKDSYSNCTSCWYRFTGYDLIPVEKIVVTGEGDDATLYLAPGETKKLTATVTPANASLPYIFWRSTNPAFATVDSEGNVTRVVNNRVSTGSDGTQADCRIIAETLYGDVVAEVVVGEAAIGALDITLSETELNIKAGETHTLTAQVRQDADVTVESESWTTSDAAIATVDNGVVTAVAQGTAVVTYTVSDNYGRTHAESCTVTVTGPNGVESIEADSAEAEYRTINGVRVNGTTLAPGLYIRRQGDKIEKVIVK